MKNKKNESVENTESKGAARYVVMITDAVAPMFRILIEGRAESKRAALEAAARSINPKFLFRKRFEIIFFEPCEPAKKNEQNN